MPTVRDIQAKLAATVTDTVLDKLGYREYTVYTPSDIEVDPSPEVKFLSGFPKDVAYTDYLRQADALDLPRDMVTMKLNRYNLDYDTVTTPGRWKLYEKATLTLTTWDLVSCYTTDDRFIVTLILYHDLSL